MNLQPTTVANALIIIGDVLGINPVTDRGEVLQYLNRIRSLWYHNFHRIRLFDDFLDCVTPEVFCVKCQSECPCTGTQYAGFTIDDSMTGINAAWNETDPYILRSRWHASFEGRHPRALQIAQIPGSFPTRLDLDCVVPQKLKVFASDRSDCNKEMVVSGFDADGKTRTIRFTLSGGGWVTSDAELISISEVILPTPRAGNIEIRQQSDSKLISQYSPHEPDVPAYSRYQINDGRCVPSQKILVHGNRQYRELYYDTDLVEIGDRLVLEHGARHFKYGENTTDRGELQRAQIDLANMFDLISGMKSRHCAGNKQDGPLSARRHRRTKRPQLPGYN